MVLATVGLSVEIWYVEIWYYIQAPRPVRKIKKKTVEVRTKSNCQLSNFFPSAVVGSCCPDKVTNPRQVMNTVPIKENTVLTEVNTELVEANTLVTKENRALTRYSRPCRQIISQTDSKTDS